MRERLLKIFVFVLAGRERLHEIPCSAILRKGRLGIVSRRSGEPIRWLGFVFFRACAALGEALIAYGVTRFNCLTRSVVPENAN